jgi:DNA-binding NarL/FixJ family response regulator
MTALTPRSTSGAVIPLVVVEGSDGAYADAVADLRSAGSTLVQGWNARRGTVCTGVVSSAEDAAAALLAAVGGAGVLIYAQAQRDVVDRLCEDLRRLGRLDHRVGVGTPRVRLTREEQALVDLLLDGESLGAAARTLNLARRTADRRLASVRAKLHVETTAEALVALGLRRPEL